VEGGNWGGKLRVHDEADQCDVTEGEGAGLAVRVGKGGDGEWEERGLAAAGGDGRM
jgi:hypothetical protein